MVADATPADVRLAGDLFRPVLERRTPVRRPGQLPDAFMSLHALDPQFRRQRRGIAPERLDERLPRGGEANSILPRELRVLAPPAR